ncbi:hypothetical protein KC878_01835 [Candidatus Saccharibacteria bacterium]|nr:hypothetical protein [Candidatus Saccharibacteria bacterium]MCB9821620.1 LOG family protein [Candidatus Nomurabacteria bacterium]
MLRFSICISGAASGDTVDNACSMAYEIGKAIAEAGHIVTTGATVGLPYFGARGAYEAGGRSIGFSPASSLREHVRKYRLPVGVFDYINFTGMHYVGRDIHLVQSSDAVITIGGRMGSLHEFTTAIEARMPCGVLLESGGTADIIPHLLEKLEEPNGTRVVFDNDPVRLVKQVIAMMEEEYKDINIEQLKKYEATFDALTCSASENHHKNRAG